MFLGVFVILSTCFLTISSLLITCHNPAGCTWDCLDNTCGQAIYNCTSIAQTCTLHCSACDGTTVYSSAETFNIICLATVQESGNDEHPTTTIDNSDTTTQERDAHPHTTRFKIHDTVIDDLDGNEAVVTKTDTRSAKALTIFATVLSTLFCFCVAICIWFVCNTKRHSKLRKDTMNVDEYDMVDVNVHKREDTHSEETRSRTTSLPPKVQEELEMKLHQMREGKRSLSRDNSDDDSKQPQLRNYESLETDTMDRTAMDTQRGIYLQFQRNDSKTVTCITKGITITELENMNMNLDETDDEDDELYETSEIVSTQQSKSVKNLIQKYDNL
eukprot:603288_1